MPKTKDFMVDFRSSEFSFQILTLKLKSEVNDEWFWIVAQIWSFWVFWINCRYRFNCGTNGFYYPIKIVLRSINRTIYADLEHVGIFEVLYCLQCLMGNNYVGSDWENVNQVIIIYSLAQTNFPIEWKYKSQQILILNFHPLWLVRFRIRLGPQQSPFALYCDIWCNNAANICDSLADNEIAIDIL